MMDRRTFLKAGAVLPVALPGVPSLAALAAGAAAGAHKWRMFEVTTEVEVLKTAGATRLWLPLPLAADTDYQRNLGSTWTAHGGKAYTAVEKRYGAGIVGAEFPEAVNPPRLTLVSRVATRDRAVDLSRPAAAAREDAALLRLNLEATELIPTDGIVRETARRITRGLRGDVEKARAIYEWVVENTFRDPKVRGCGWGDIRTMLETRYFGGKCGDLNTLFVGLARAAGVAARDVYGVRIARSGRGFQSLGANTGVVTKAQHCRAEFYAAGHGWIPVDPADVRKVVLEEPPGKLVLTDRKVQRARAMLFGAWEMNWMAFNYAHDVGFPGAKGPKLPYFMYPNGETAGGRLDQLDPDTFKYTITARELTVAA